MPKFIVHFKFVGGEEKSLTVERENYHILAAEVMSETNQWFSEKEELVNLCNVTTCRITELTDTVL